MKVLVTGGSGFIGSHVVDKLAEAGLTPRIYDVIPSPWHEPGTVDTYHGDLDDQAALEDAMQGCDAVLHLAAVADVNQVNLDPLFADKVNVRGTINVLEAARQTGIKRVVYASTIWAYNGCGETHVDEDTQLGLPNHVYTASKIAGEMYCTSYAELYGVEYTILRFGIPYGTRARPAAVVPQFVRKALAGEPLTVAGGGAQTRRFVYVEDLADGCVAGLLPQAANRVFNLVGTEDTSILEIAEVVKDLIGDVDIVHTEGRAGDFRGVEVSHKRAKEELNWEARVPFKEGVKRYLDWHLATHEAATEVDAV